MAPASTGLLILLLLHRAFIIEVELSQKDVVKLDARLLSLFCFGVFNLVLVESATHDH